MQHQKAIGLDDAQKGFIRSEIAKAQGRFTELQWQLQDAMESLVALLGQKAPDEQQDMAQLEKALNVERESKRAQLGLMVRLRADSRPISRLTCGSCGKNRPEIDGAHHS